MARGDSAHRPTGGDSKMNEHQREWRDLYRALARSRGGTCLSREYHNGETKLRWRCAAGHEWEAPGKIVKSGHWCRLCGIATRVGRSNAEALARVQEVARERGGRCLSTEYAAAPATMRWRCAEGHEWAAAASAIRRGSWCRFCANETHNGAEKRRTFAAVQAFAREQGGRCLSTEYVNCLARMRWRCAEGHEWEATAGTVRQGTWCPQCAYTRRYGDTHAKIFARVQAAARARGGVCLSERYVNATTHLRFRCAEGHEWQAMPSNVSRGTWCPRCAGHVVTLADLQEVARARGGRCLSRKYEGDLVPVRWRCAEGHEWMACQYNVRRGTWCPRCAGRACPTLEDVQAIAAGHGGVCLATRIASSQDVIRCRCRVGHEFSTKVIYVTNGKWCATCRKMPRGGLEKLQQVVRQNGGVLLETEYQSSQAPVRVRCREGHEWRSTAASLIYGRWCQQCSIAAARGRSKPRFTIVDMQELAASRGGRCLSEVYVNGLTPLRWQCHDGHEWDAKPEGIRGGRWCPTCGFRYRGTIDAMRALAAERGGTCRSRTYRHHREPLRFTCAQGHDFIATGMVVKSGVWCPECQAPKAPSSGRRREPARAQRSTATARRGER